jgi:predicted amidohydrolase
VIIALASLRVAASVEEGLDKIKQSLSEAAAGGAAIVCFPEAYLPGLWGLDFDVPPFDRDQQERALRVVAEWARMYRVATVLGIEWHAGAGRQIAAVVIGAGGEVQGVQTKNQLDPTEEPLYVPGCTR